jgi:protein-disulfide isomerase
MNKHEEHSHHGNHKEIVENFSEQGPVTVETIDITDKTHVHPTKKTKTGLSTPAAIIIAAIILGISHLGYGMLAGGKNSSPLQAFKGKSIDESDYATGKTNSKVIVLEYSDSECPFCAQLHPTLEKLKTEYNSKVAFVYRYFPLTQIHKNAFDEAKAIYCVGKLEGSEKRDSYIDKIFSEKLSKQNMVFPAGRKESIAKELGISESAFSSCLNANETSNVITSSIQDGVAAGVQGTPATFILIKNKKGYDVVSMVDGARPYDYIKAAIDEALAR